MSIETHLVPSAARTLPIDSVHRYGGFSLYYGRIAAPAQFAEHAHPLVEVGVPFQGAAGPASVHNETGRTVTHRIDERYIGVLSPQQPHWGDWEREAEVLVWYIEPAFLVHAAHDMLRGNGVEIVAAPRAEDALIRQLGLALRTEVAHAGTPSLLYVESLTTVLATHLLRQYAVATALVAGRVQRLSPVVLSRVRDYIQVHLAQDLTLADIARVAGMSPERFGRAFKHTTSYSPHQYVLRCRVDAAQQLLRQSPLTTATIATQVGFYDQSHFTRVFKQLTGWTPGAFRRRNK